MELQFLCLIIDYTELLTFLATIGNFYGFEKPIFSNSVKDGWRIEERESADALKNLNTHPMMIIIKSMNRKFIIGLSMGNLGISPKRKRNLTSDG